MTGRSLSTHGMRRTRPADSKEPATPGTANVAAASLASKVRGHTASISASPGITRQWPVARRCLICLSVNPASGPPSG